MIAMHYISVAASLISTTMARELPEYHATAHRLQKRGCTEKSWKGGEVLTRPAENVQIVSNTVVGGASVEIAVERTQTYTTSMDLGLDEIISLGISDEFNESISSSTIITKVIPKGQHGVVGFTATLSCSTGKGQCSDGDVEGEVCCKCVL